MISSLVWFYSAIYIPLQWRTKDPFNLQFSGSHDYFMDSQELNLDHILLMTITYGLKQTISISFPNIQYTHNKTGWKLFPHTFFNIRCLMKLTRDCGFHRNVILRSIAIGKTYISRINFMSQLLSISFDIMDYNKIN